MANYDTEYVDFKKDGDRYYFRDNRYKELRDDIDKNKEDISKANESIKNNADNISTANTNIENNANGIAKANENIDKNAKAIKDNKDTDDSRYGALQENLTAVDQRAISAENDLRDADTATNTRVSSLEKKVADLGAYSIIGIDQQISIPVNTSSWTAQTPYISVQSGFRSNSIPATDEIICAYTSAGNAPGTATDIFLTSINTISNPTNGTKYIVMAYYLRLEASSNPGSTVNLPFDLHIVVRRKNS